tara:strand:+ start:40 stop:312 length:273 start_codon:yes stop_codon:yes gene_type:complete
MVKINTQNLCLAVFILTLVLFVVLLVRQNNSDGFFGGNVEACKERQKMEGKLSDINKLLLSSNPSERQSLLMRKRLAENNLNYIRQFCPD